MQLLSALNFSATESGAELKGNLDLETCKKQDMMVPPKKTRRKKKTMNIHEDVDKVKFIQYCLNKNKKVSHLSENLQKAELSDGKY